jgi:hypothetical protein
MPLPWLNELFDVQQTLWLYVQSAFLEGLTLGCAPQILVAECATARCHPEVIRTRLVMTHKENLVVVFHDHTGGDSMLHCHAP